MKNILVAIDIGDQEEVLIEKAIELAEKFNSKIWIVHASAPDPDFVSFEAGPQSVRDERAKSLHKENRIIGTLSDKVKSKGLESAGLLIRGVTVDVILEESEKLNAELLIIGHKKHGFIEKLIRGSVSGGVLQHSKIPVMTVPLD